MENINFCPSCGRKLEGSPKFCPECGKALGEGKTTNFSFTKLVGSVSDVIDKMKSNDASNNDKSSERTKDRQFQLSNMQWLLILGAYLVIFWDFVIGVTILLLLAIYSIAKKKAPAKTAKFTESCKEKFSPIISNPPLKKGVIILLIGLLLYRIGFLVWGVIFIVFSVALLITHKFSPSVAERIANFVDEQVLVKVKTWWNKKWVKGVVIAVSIILPFLSVPTTMNISSATVGGAVQEAYIDYQIEQEEESDDPDEFEILRLRYCKLQTEATKAIARGDMETYEWCQAQGEDIKEQIFEEYNVYLP